MLQQRQPEQPEQAADSRHCQENATNIAGRESEREGKRVAGKGRMCRQAGREGAGNKNSNSGISDNSISHDVAQCLFSILRRRMSDASLRCQRRGVVHAGAAEVREWGEVK